MIELPKRADGTVVSPWDDDWKDYTNIGRQHDPWNGVHPIIYEPKLWRETVVKPKVWDIPECVKTGEHVDPGVLMMFVKGAYKTLFDRLYATSSST